MTSGKLLIVDDDKVALKNLEQVMKKAGHAVVATQSSGNALALLEKQPFDVVLSELHMDKVDMACRSSSAAATTIPIPKSS